ncbi:hypothetical protein JW964_21480 [candidate division KSB1 bacterium]|nr:hypothetical protein [candidate division KSB1 bacterium]
MLKKLIKQGVFLVPLLFSLLLVGCYTQLDRPGVEIEDEYADEVDDSSAEEYYGEDELDDTQNIVEYNIYYDDWNDYPAYCRPLNRWDALLLFPTYDPWLNWYAWYPVHYGYGRSWYGSGWYDPYWYSYRHYGPRWRWDSYYYGGPSWGWNYTPRADFKQRNFGQRILPSSHIAQRTGERRLGREDMNSTNSTRRNVSTDRTAVSSLTKRSAPTMTATDRVKRSSSNRTVSDTRVTPRTRTNKSSSNGTAIHKNRSNNKPPATSKRSSSYSGSSSRRGSSNSSTPSSSSSSSGSSSRGSSYSGSTSKTSSSGSSSSGSSSSSSSNSGSSSSSSKKSSSGRR